MTNPIDLTENADVRRWLLEDHYPNYDRGDLIDLILSTFTQDEIDHARTNMEEDDE